MPCKRKVRKLRDDVLPSLSVGWSNPFVTDRTADTPFSPRALCIRPGAPRSESEKTSATLEAEKLDARFGLASLGMPFRPRFHASRLFSDDLLEDGYTGSRGERQRREVRTKINNCQQSIKKKPWGLVGVSYSYNFTRTRIVYAHTNTHTHTLLLILYLNQQCLQHALFTAYHKPWQNQAVRRHIVGDSQFLVGRHRDGRFRPVNHTM